MHSVRMKIHAPVRAIFPYVSAERYHKGKVVTRKPVLPSEEEMESNSRSKRRKAEDI